MARNSSRLPARVRITPRPCRCFGAVLASWIMSSWAEAHFARAFEGRLIYTLIVASAVGAVTGSLIAEYVFVLAY